MLLLAFSVLLDFWAGSLLFAETEWFLTLQVVSLGFDGKLLTRDK